jgi:hypothetical protein
MQTGGTLTRASTMMYGFAASKTELSQSLFFISTPLQVFCDSNGKWTDRWGGPFWVMLPTVKAPSLFSEDRPD